MVSFYTLVYVITTAKKVFKTIFSKNSKYGRNWRFKIIFLRIYN